MSKSVTYVPNPSLDAQYITTLNKLIEKLKNLEAITIKHLDELGKET
jgi:hypothetical protein